jgi:hypothetical protein
MNEHAGNDHAGQAAQTRHRILTFWGPNRGPFSGAFSTIDAYLALFGDIIPGLDRQFGGYDFIPPGHLRQRRLRRDQTGPLHPVRGDGKDDGAARVLAAISARRAGGRSMGSSAGLPVLVGSPAPAVPAGS